MKLRTTRIINLAMLAVLIWLLVVQPILPWPREQFAYDSIRWAQVILLAGFCCCLLFQAQTLLSIAPVGIALLVLGSLSTLSAAQPAIALREWALLLSLLAGTYVVMRCLFEAQSLIWTLRIVIAGQMLYILLLLGLLVAALVLEGAVNYWKLFAGYENPRHYNHVQTLLIPLMAGASNFAAIGKPWRRLAWIALAGHVCLLMLLLGRGTCVALIGASLVAIVVLGRPGRVFVLRLMTGVIAGVALYLLVTKGLPTLLNIADTPAFRDVAERNSVDARFYLWKVAVADVMLNLWLGVGPMHFAHAFNNEAAHPHNIYLQVAAEYGLPFALLLFGLIWRTLWKTSRSLRQYLAHADDQIAVGAFAACLAALFDGFFSGNFVMPAPQLWMMLISAILAARLVKPSGEIVVAAPVGQARLFVWRTAVLALLLSQCATIVPATREMQHERVNLIGGQLNPGDHLSPRFWLDGWF